MNNCEFFDVVVIGGGPAGMAAALSAEKEGAKVLLIEREGQLGGILKQCIHDGFGVIKFNKKMAGTEYAQHFIDRLGNSSVEVSLLSFVSNIYKDQNQIFIEIVGRQGLRNIISKSVVLSTGCRERTAKQIAIHGTRPAGVFTAGTAQYYTNILGQLPTKKCVILGSGDIGLIMARRLTLEGAKVLGVYEAKPTPSGLTRNIVQCLDDFNIPLYTNHTVTKVFGKERLTAVEICKVEDMQPVEGSSQIVECDALILSVGLIPENELAERLEIAIDDKTKGPICDQTYMTSKMGIYSCGNALHVNDLVDYVTESGEVAGFNSANYNGNRNLCKIEADENFLYTVPQRLDISKNCNEVTVFFRSKENRTSTYLSITVDGKVVFSKLYTHLRPPEMEKITVDFSQCKLSSRIKLSLKDVTI